MITAIHTLIYSDDAEATRSFMTNVLGWPSIDAGGGWLIFGTGPSEMGVHPTHSEWEGQTYTSPRHHLIVLLCDDIHTTIADLKSKGAEFEGDVIDRGYGWVTILKVPGADDIQICQPSHELAYKL